MVCREHAYSTDLPKVCVDRCMVCTFLESLPGPFKVCHNSQFQNKFLGCYHGVFQYTSRIDNVHTKQVGK